jgi:protein-tyrosine phosphatase
VIDLHAHILPGLDDGPATEEEAVSLARAAVAAGTRALAATSHVDVGFGLTPDVLDAARDSMAERLAREGIALELLAGGEIAPARLPDLDDATLARLALGGGSTVLLECPFAPVGSTMELMVGDLRRRGFDVLLAHPERSPTFQREPERLERLLDLGAHAQVTAGSLSGGFGGTVLRVATAMLEAGLVQVIGSDAHDTARRRPDLRTAAEALEARYGDVDEQLAWMTEAAPAAVLAGERLPARPPLPRARGLRDRLRRAWSAR